ncbi:hypothetical protein DFH06DRAFT_1331545 [Mycena polygramma]|nr:hypothetical protein DFH06DRAFT_1331545 [Mycena polygramma]
MTPPNLSTSRVLRSRRRGPHPFWHINDLVLYLLTYLNLVQLVKFSHINRRCRDYAERYLRGRITRYTSPFFTKNRPLLDGDIRRPLVFERFFLTLEVTRSWVVGSVASAAASLLYNGPCPKNLNIITYAHLGTWLSFFRNEAGFEVFRGHASNGAYARTGRIVVYLRHKEIENYYVSITTSRHPNLGALFFASPNTNQWIAIGASQLITPVLENVSEQRHLKGWRPWLHLNTDIDAPPIHYTYCAGGLAYFEKGITLDLTTADWGVPCGRSCPGVWRAARGLGGIARVRWGGINSDLHDVDPVLEELGRSRLRFRLGTSCKNQFCRNSPAYINRDTDENLVIEATEADGPAQVAEGENNGQAIEYEIPSPANYCHTNASRYTMTRSTYPMEYQDRVRETILTHQPPLAGITMCLLFAACGAPASLVPVPLRTGLSEGTSADDLDITWWLPLSRAPNAAMVDLERTRLTITHWPLESEWPLENSLTICVVPQLGPEERVPDDSPPINEWFWEETYGTLTPFRGNALMIKQALSGGLADMTEADVALAEAVLRLVVDERLVGFRRL